MFYFDVVCQQRKWSMMFRNTYPINDSSEIYYSRYPMRLFSLKGFALLKTKQKYIVG